MQGTIIQINISPGGLPKRPIPQGRIGPEGLEGDAHAHPEFHGGLRKAVLLIAAEVVDDLAARGYPVFYGALGENLTMRGLDVRGLRVGDRLRAGSATLEITQLRVPCSQLDVYGDSLKGDLYDARVKAGDRRLAALGHERILFERGGTGLGGAGRYNCASGRACLTDADFARSRSRARGGAYPTAAGFGAGPGGGNALPGAAAAGFLFRLRSHY